MFLFAPCYTISAEENQTCNSDIDVIAQCIFMTEFLF